MSFFFFKQKTAYEMRISDWSSDVCSSDLRVLAATLILNIALLLFGWRRYDDLNREVRERTEAEKRARYLADTDPLTDFLNRRALISSGQALIAEATRERRHVALFLLDLEDRKSTRLNSSH